MPHPTPEEFATICELNAREADALRRILSEPRILATAEAIARACFFPGGADTPPAPESADLSRAWFAAAYLSFGHSRDCFRALGFPDAVWRDTMTDLKVWLRNEARNRGVIGLGPLARPWEVELYHGRVTRHGRLECNTEFQYGHEPLLDDSRRVLLAPGAPVINLHIPEDGPLDLAECSASLKRIDRFFAQCRPDYAWQGFLCESWLLDRQLLPMLPPGSNIARFQALGRHYPMHPTDDTIFRIFGTAAPTAIARPTSLQASAARFLQNGGQFIEEGMFIPRDAIEAVDFDLTRLPDTR